MKQQRYVIISDHSKPGKLLLTAAAIIFLIFHPSLKCQILSDTACMEVIKRGINNIYNLEINNADEALGYLEDNYPESPVIFLFRGLKIYWGNYPLVPSSSESITYEENMRRCIELCENNIDPANEAENLLANLCARGMLLLFFNDNDITRQVISLVISTYPYIRRSFDYISSWADFQYFTGLYNYYREAYPEINPIYKPLALLFPGGDKDVGVMQLRNASLNAIVLSAESYSMLFWVSMNFENDYEKSLEYISKLTELYPSNPYYKALYIKNLLLAGDYLRAEAVIESAKKKFTNKFFESQLLIFTGILQEKYYKNYDLAEDLYMNGIDSLSLFETYGNEYIAYGYFGLLRISEARGDKEAKKEYRKKANRLADFKKINFDN